MAKNASTSPTGTLTLVDEVPTVSRTSLKPSKLQLLADQLKAAPAGKWAVLAKDVKATGYLGKLRDFNCEVTARATGGTYDKADGTKASLVTVYARYIHPETATNGTVANA